MDITAFIHTHREVLLIGDYATYRASLSRQLNSLRRKLHIITPKRDKFTAKPVTPEQIGSDHGFAHLLLLTSERAWAHAMHIKTSHADEGGKSVSGDTRSHIISKLHKAAVTASSLVDLLKNGEVTKANEQDVLEARAYLATLAGGEEFEKHSTGPRTTDSKESEQRWKRCLRNFAEARVIYAALYEKERKEVYKNVLADTVDPTIRYAAYQAHLSRTIAIPTVAKRYFPKDDAALVSQVEAVDQWALKDKPAPKNESEKQASPLQEIPNSVTWRGRKANIVDASIGQALAAVSTASARLREYLSSNASAPARDKAAAYDDVLIASQDAADAAKRATDELEKERVDEGDPRMQDLRVTSLAVNYDLVSWRVGRNRVLIGADDGLTFSPQPPKRPKGTRKDGTPYPVQEESRGRKLARLRERAVLYDTTIQSIASVKDLRGAVRDSTFVSELDAKASYFRALKCVNISYSHALLSQHLEALALLQRAKDLLKSHPINASSMDSEGDVDMEKSEKPPTLDMPTPAHEAAASHVSSLITRMHALVELYKLQSNSALASKKNLASAAPLISDLGAFPSPGTQVNLANLVTYPPKIQPVPVKPLFLDVAWNYIEYPGRQKRPAAAGVAEKVSEKVTAAVNGTREEESAEQPKKKGWFGFGRG